MYPSFLISNATGKSDDSESDESVLGDPLGQIGIEITSPGSEVPVTVKVECQDFIETSEFTGTLAEEGATYTVKPKIRYRYDRLSKCKQATPATATFTVQVGDEAPVTESVTFTMHSVNDCPHTLVVGDETVDIGHTFAAYVNEQHPFTDKLLREALDRGIVTHFDGYQSGSPLSVVRQVYAVWDLLVARDMRYSSITSTAATSPSVYCQNVRLIEESINNSQANCVDGSVLLVSLLRKINIDAGLVLTPNHCYVVFQGDTEGKTVYGVETTLTGAELEAPEELPSDLDQAVEESLRDEWSWPSFVQALIVGTTGFVENTKQAEADPASGISLINIQAARSLGILPIPFDGKDAFKPIEQISETTKFVSTESASDEVADESEEAEEEEADDEDEGEEWAEEDSDVEEDDESGSN